VILAYAEVKQNGAFMFEACRHRNSGTGRDHLEK